MKRFLSAVRAWLNAALDMRDIFALGGLALACYGIHQIYPPAAAIVGGGALFWLGVRS